MRLLPASLHALIISGSILIGAGKGEAATPGLRFVVIPKVTHPWFEAVHGGAKAAAQMIQGQTNTPVVIDYRPPAKAEAEREGIPITVFDSEPPADLPMTSIGANFCQQAQITAQRLANLLGGQPCGQRQR